MGKTAEAEKNPKGGSRKSAKSFFLGGIVGASAALVARGRRGRRRGVRGLAAFEDAPCFRESEGQKG